MAPIAEQVTPSPESGQVAQHALTAIGAVGHHVKNGCSSSDYTRCGAFPPPAAAACGTRGDDWPPSTPQVFRRK